jgi:hypothetical protein
MGGNLFKDKGGRRITEDELIKTVKDIRYSFNRIFNAEKSSNIFEIPHYIADKKDFGDIDILMDIDLKERFLIYFPRSEYVVVNGDVVSFLWKSMIQVDVIFLPRDVLDFAHGYFSYNDLGNLIGRIAHKMGMKFGHDGLHLPVRDGTNMLGVIRLTRTFSEAIEFLGYSFELWNEGFENREAVFRYVSGHPRFSPRIYLLDNRNHAARVRDRKRPTYTAFLEWIDEKRGYLNDFCWEKHPKESFLPEIFAEFPHAQVEHAALWTERNRAIQAKEQYPMVRIGELLNIEGKELGKFITAFKEKHGDMVDYIHANTVESIDKDVLEFEKEMKNAANEKAV